MTYEVIVNTIFVVGVPSFVLCVLYAMQRNVIIGNETLVYRAVCIVWGLILIPFIIAIGWMTGVLLAYLSIKYGHYLTMALLT